VDTANVIYFDDGDTYYTLLNVVDSCSACTSGSYARVTAVHLTLYFPFAPETLRVRAGVVDVVPIATCPADPRLSGHYQDRTQTICAPFEAVLIAPDPLVTLDFAIPYPTECQIRTPPYGRGEAFLWFEFMTANDTTEIHKPRIATQDAENFCRSYNPVGFNERIDFVVLYDMGNPVMYADIEECLSVPTRRRTWGQLKLLYR
jgi:hypothetical protein